MKSKTLALELKAARIQHGFTQAEVAAKLGYSNPQFVSNWERGVSSPPLNILRELIKIYNLDKDEIVLIIIRDIKQKLEKSIA